MVSPSHSFVVDVRVSNCENLEYVEQLSLGFIQRISEKYCINISSLRRLIITDKFYDDIVQFNNERGMNVSPTRNNFSKCVAKLVPEIAGGQLKITVFVDYLSLFIGLDDDEKLLCLWNVIHHELCHVEDAERIFNMKNREISHGESFVERFFIDIAESMWSEYYACRKSVQSMPSTLERDVCLLLLMVEIKDTVNRLIVEYRIDHDLDKVIDRCFPVMRQKLICMARVAGSSDGLEVSLDRIQNEIFMKFKMSEEYDIFLKSTEILRDMYGNINKWEIREVYTRLLDVAEEYVNMMGFYCHKIDENSAYIEIPFRPDNTPF